MGVRLNKVLSELNIGLQTAVDFLKKKTELGDIKEDATPNTKISDEQYDALVDQFSSDKAVKSQAEKLFVKKPKEPKKVETPEKAVTKTEAPSPNELQLIRLRMTLVVWLYGLTASVKANRRPACCSASMKGVVCNG